MNTVTIQAMAKINLGLDVLHRREDGYHEVKMVMQTINLYDTLRFSLQDKPGITIRIDGADLPTNEDNLIDKAARLLYDRYPIDQGVEIALVKKIPVAAGMAGGSTDAAATLAGLSLLFGLGCSEEELKRLGVTIGADIPYCIQGGTVLSEGIGEKLTTLPGVPPAWLVVAKPDIDVSTAYVYGNLRLDAIKKHPDIDGMVDALYRQDIVGIAEKMENVLETVTERDYPVIGELKTLLKRKGALNALMSGSGPTVFGIFDEESKAKEALRAVRKTSLAPQSFLTTFINTARVVVKER